MLYYVYVLMGLIWLIALINYLLTYLLYQICRALIGQAVSEKKIFEYYGDIHLYCPRVGADRPIGSIFKNHISSVHLPISLMFFSSNDFFDKFPLQMHGPPMLTLP